jgi:hypothetical protein
MKKKLIVSICIAIVMIVVLVLVINDGSSGEGYVGNWKYSDEKDVTIVISKNKSDEKYSINGEKVLFKKGFYTLKCYTFSKGKNKLTAVYENGYIDKEKELLIFDRSDYSFLKNGYKIIDGNTLQKYTVNTKKDAELPLEKDFKIYRVEDKK